jgi:hypothetical protein
MTIVFNPVLARNWQGASGIVGTWSGATRVALGAGRRERVRLVLDPDLNYDANRLPRNPNGAGPFARMIRGFSAISAAICGLDSSVRTARKPPWNTTL